MEKYGVADVKKQQEDELSAVRLRLRTLNSSQEKTASESKEAEGLESRVTELQGELHTYDQGGPNQ